MECHRILAHLQQPVLELRWDLINLIEQGKPGGGFNRSASVNEPIVAELMKQYFTVPCVDSLPPGTEATTDVPYPLQPLEMTAMDLTEPAIEAILSVLKPHFVLYDYTHWLPTLAHKLGIKAILYCSVSSVTIGYLLSPERKLREKILTETDLMNPPSGFPSSMIKLSAHEARRLVFATVQDFGEAMMTDCQLVLLPYVGDQIINARLMGGDLKVGVEVEKGEEDGLFTREGVCRAVKTVMDENSEVGKQVKENHAKHTKFLMKQGLECTYIDGFVKNLHDLLKT
ncbi:hypothetical protein LWI29_013688 [Acer saccharum]|uniref:Uncharacterized protein n=1 Tax=Acer saccharum TaxID=4024 RepID=A0AA39RQX9_ACESA|nr:hypothetical protein LWI29_013688 [Acer saccharum]